LTHKKLSRRAALAIALTVITLVSSAVATMDTANYFRFFDALARVQLNLTSLQYTPRSYFAEANITFTIQNPTGYRGLAMQFFEPSFVVNATGATVISQGVVIQQQTRSLEPDKKVTVAFPFNSTWNQSWSKPQFVFTINIGLSTFLDQAATVSSIYLCQSRGGPGTCEQLAVGIEGTGPFGRGGGGGA
jgi:hypothetical protein